MKKWELEWGEYLIQHSVVAVTIEYNNGDRDRITASPRGLAERELTSADAKPSRDQERHDGSPAS